MTKKKLRGVFPTKEGYYLSYDKRNCETTIMKNGRTVFKGYLSNLKDSFTLKCFIDGM